MKRDLEAHLQAESCSPAWGSLPYLRNAALDFPFSGSTRNKALRELGKNFGRRQTLQISQISHSSCSPLLISYKSAGLPLSKSKSGISWRAALVWGPLVFAVVSINPFALKRSSIKSYLESSCSHLPGIPTEKLTLEVQMKT